MISSRQLKLEDKSVIRQNELLEDLQALARDIERCEYMISELKTELEEVNSKFQGSRDTRRDIDYLTALLACAKKKLAWEKQMASLQKRTPEILDRMKVLMNDPKAPPTEQMRDAMLKSLQQVQATMERLQTVKPD
jgi:uncharacterized protein YoxC